MSSNIEDEQSEWGAEPMSEAPRVEKSGVAPLPYSSNNELNEIAWQKWVNKNKERDAAYRKLLIRMLWVVSLLILVSVVAWQLTVSK
jgi:hypothetical protein